MRKYIRDRILYTQNMHIFWVFGLCVNFTEIISYKDQRQVTTKQETKTSLTDPHWLKCQLECIRGKKITLNLCLLVTTWTMNKVIFDFQCIRNGNLIVLHSEESKRFCWMTESNTKSHRPKLPEAKGETMSWDVDVIVSETHWIGQFWVDTERTKIFRSKQKFNRPWWQNRYSILWLQLKMSRYG